MGILIGFLVALFIPVCLLLPVVILLQDSKGEGLASSAFGGSGMQSILGGRGAATFLTKLTTGLAIAFFIMSLFLMRFYGNTSGELKPLNQGAVQTQESLAPAVEVETTDTETPSATTTDTQPSASDPADK